jgi:predicted metalloprotease
LKSKIAFLNCDEAGAILGPFYCPSPSEGFTSL